MKITYAAKKTGAVLVAAAMLTSLASCDMLLGSKAVVEAAESFGDAVASGSADKILKLSNEEKDSEIAEALDLILDDDLRTDDFKAYSDAMKDTITYEVDSGSVKIDGKKASCDITFTMADYEDLDDGEYEDIDDIVDAIEDLGTKEYEFTIKFEKDGDDWLVSNLDSDDFGAILEYRSYDLPVCDITGDYVATYDLTSVLTDSLASAGIDESTLTGSISVEFSLSIYDDGTCEVFFNGEQVYSDMLDYINNNMDAMFMGAFGTDSLDDLNEYAQMLGYEDYDAMKDDLADQIAESVADDDIGNISKSGTYTVEGSTITFDIEDYAESSVGTIENGNIIFGVEVDDSIFGTDTIDLVFEPVAVG